MVAGLKPHVETLRRLEREAADRLVGLDTRPFEWLLEQARAQHAHLADVFMLKLEEEMRRCRNFIRPVRHECAGASEALVRVIEELVAGAAGDETKMGYGVAMPRCERAVGFVPLTTTLRIVR
jgi:hypothetical protein